MAPPFVCRRCDQQLEKAGHTMHCPFCEDVSRYRCLIGREKSISKCWRLFSREHARSSSSSSSNSNSVLNLNPSHRPTKRAVLCGVSYQKRKYRLKGTVNDVKNMRALLVDCFNFPKECIRVLTDQDTHQHLTPTKSNIEDSLKWLVKDSQPGDSLVFYFSGHGIRQPDFNRDEIDGFDETLCPTDFLKQGVILDNDLNSTIVRPLQKGVTLHAIVDACHSATILDLTNVYNRKEKKWEDNSPPSKATKATSGGLAISLTACEDDKLAADSTGMDEKNMNGIMTYFLADLLRKHRGPTYGDLLDMMDEAIEEFNKGGRLHTLFRKLVRRKQTQRTQLSSSERFDVYKTHFIL